MSMHEDFTQPLRRFSDITPERLETYLREARLQRALAFNQLLRALGRGLRRPFRAKQRPVPQQARSSPA